MFKFSYLFVIVLCIGIIGCNGKKGTIKGVVESITPLGGDIRTKVLIKFKDGRCCNVNYWGGKVHCIVIGKYNVIAYDSCGDITDISQIEAEVNFGEN